MAENQENIEAQLCAYIDGELDAKGRAEIEKHLANNPQHQQLIAGLIESRAMLRALPRERAPDDVIETLQHSLERSVLLENIDDESYSTPLRIRPRSHVMLAAALVLLTIGLGAVVYFVLPPMNKQPEYAAVTPSRSGGADARSTTQPTGALRLETADTRAIKDGEIAMLDAAKSEARKLKTAEIDVFAKAPGSKVDDAKELANRERGSLFFNTLPMPGKFAPADDANQLMVVVNTDNFDVTNGQVTHFLTANGIAWQEASEAMPAPLDISQNQLASGSQLRTATVQLRQPKVEDIGGGNTSVAKRSEDITEQKQFAGATTAPAQAPTRDLQTLNEQQRSWAINNTDLARNARNKNVVYANMTRRQATELQSTLANSRVGQQAIFYDNAVEQITQSAAGSAPARHDRNAAAQHAYSLHASVTTRPAVLPPAPTTSPAPPAAVAATVSPPIMSKKPGGAVAERDKDAAAGETFKQIAPGGEKFAHRAASAAPTTQVAKSAEPLRGIEGPAKDIQTTGGQLQVEQKLEPASPSIIAAQTPATQPTSQPASHEALVDVVIVVNAQFDDAAVVDAPAIVPATLPAATQPAASPANVP